MGGSSMTVKGLNNALSARIMALSGKVVASVGNTEQGNVAVDVSSLTKGLYFNYSDQRRLG
jgi:hypothetical protein